MRIGILTLYFNNSNYGGQLQAYALCEYFNSLNGVKCEQITYKYKKNQTFSLKHILFYIYEHLFHPRIMFGLSSRKKAFASFSKKIPHSIVYNKENIKNCNDIYDYVFVGSDQVWNPEFSDETFSLEFLKKEKRCSYAASFGSNNMDKFRSLPWIQSLGDYNWLSVREKNAKIFLETYLNRKCYLVCDPTILIPISFWKKKISNGKKVKIDGDYLFVYLLGDSKLIREGIREYAIINKLKIITIPHIHFSFQKRDIAYSDCELYNIDPIQFISLINDAKLIITDSFHCCVFSILFKKKFWAIDRAEGNQLSTTSRLCSLLEEVDLKSRFVMSISDINSEELIDYDGVVKKLKKYRKQSIDEVQSFIKNNI